MKPQRYSQDRLLLSSGTTLLQLTAPPCSSRQFLLSISNFACFGQLMIMTLLHPRSASGCRATMGHHLITKITDLSFLTTQPVCPVISYAVHWVCPPSSIAGLPLCPSPRSLLLWYSWNETHPSESRRRPEAESPDTSRCLVRQGQTP